MRKLVMTLLAAATAAGWACGASAQTGKSIWDGVYTEAQATRGSQQYFQHCSVCHAANLAGTFETPPLVGQFMPDWAGSSLDDLYGYVSSAMPLDHPDSLSPAAYADIVAFLLKSNGLPAGQTELQPGDDLKSISFDAVRAPAAAPDRKKAKK